MKKIMSLAGIGALLLGACTTEPADTEQFRTANATSAIPSDAVVIDFEGFNSGDIVSEVTPNEGCDGTIGVYAENLSPMNALAGSNSAMIFFSSPETTAELTGEDVDLGTPNDSFPGGVGVSSEGPQASNDVALGNVLIITEDGDSSDPDDSYYPGTFYAFDFTGYGTGSVTLFGFDMLDLDGVGAGGLDTEVFLYNDNLVGDPLVFSAVIPSLADNSKQWVDLGGTEGVTRMVISLNNSGAIDNITLKCEDREKFEGCETAFGRATEDARCFLEDDFSRWGWTNEMEDGDTLKLEMFAGAAQCSTEKGALVGYVTVTFEAGTATATYEVFDGIQLEETHFYAGETKYPQQKRGKRYVDTVAPGQYPASGGDELSVSDLGDGPIWVIAHAVVCGED